MQRNFVSKKLLKILRRSKLIKRRIYSREIMMNILTPFLIGAILLLQSFIVFGAEIDNGIAEFKSGRYTEAMKILVPLANSGNDEAQRIVGEMCYNGQGVKRDINASFKWTEISASNGNKIAQYNLGYLYEIGGGVAISLPQAIEWYEKAAIQGHIGAQHKLGDLYSAIDRNKAIYWYESAGQRGDEVAREKFAMLSSKKVADDWESEKARDEKKRKQELQERKVAQRERKRREAEAERVSQSDPQFRSPTPFDGLDAINQVMIDGQRQRDEAAAARSGARTVSQVMREAEAKQAYESSVSESSSDSSNSSSSSSSSSKSSNSSTKDSSSNSKKYVYVVDEVSKYFSRKSAADGCQKLEEEFAKSANKTVGVTVKRKVISRGSCTCDDISERSNYVAFNCHLPIKVEETSEVPLGKGSGPASGVSR
ncbi:MAG: hypothetical protein HOP21_12490 [Methylotenera sp.]|nr:hypothetical protein [Methylotenera sp.]